MTHNFEICLRRYEPIKNSTSTVIPVRRWYDGQSSGKILGPYRGMKFSRARIQRCREYRPAVISFRARNPLGGASTNYRLAVTIDRFGSIRCSGLKATGLYVAVPRCSVRVFRSFLSCPIVVFLSCKNSVKKTVGVDSNRYGSHDCFCRGDCWELKNWYQALR